MFRGQASGDEGQYLAFTSLNNYSLALQMYYTKPYLTLCALQPVNNVRSTNVEGTVYMPL